MTRSIGFTGYRKFARRKFDSLRKKCILGNMLIRIRERNVEGRQAYLPDSRMINS